MLSTMTSQLPLVSVIMPAYNAAAFIRQALKSVLFQTYRNLEVIVVDDGSVDETAQIAAGFSDERLKVFCVVNGGVAKARNYAIEKSSGSFIAPIDADDIWLPEKIERQVECVMRAEPSVGLVYAWWGLVDEGDSLYAIPHRPTAEGHVYLDLLRSNFIGNASVPLIRRSCFENVGGYDIGMKEQGGQGCEDWDLYLRIAERYDFQVVPEYLVGYRKVGGSMTSRPKMMARSFELLMGRLKTHDPDIDEEFCRTRTSDFYFYLARTCYMDGDHSSALQWALRSLRLETHNLLDWRMTILLLTSLPMAATGPLASVFWPHRRSWHRLRYTRLHQRLTSVANEPVSDGNDGGPGPQDAGGVPGSASKALRQMPPGGSSDV